MYKNIKPVYRKMSNEKKREGSCFYTRDSRYGLKYRCMYCGKDNLGISFGDDMARMHHPGCVVISGDE